jgi:hypothetical protein
LSAFYADANAWGYAQVDNSVLHNGNPSIRVGPDYVRGSREVDGAWIGVNPGDHIVYSVWIKTSAYKTSDMFPGGRLGMDFYIGSSRGGGIATCDASGYQAGHPNDVENVAGNWRVVWGSDWTQVTWDLHIPTTYYTYVTTTVNGVPGIYTCNPVQINSMVAWFDVRGATDTANAWFADPQLYINP